MLQGNHDRYKIKISRKNNWIVQRNEMIEIKNKEMIESHAVEKGFSKHREWSARRWATRSSCFPIQLQYFTKCCPTSIVPSVSIVYVNMLDKRNFLS